MHAPCLLLRFGECEAPPRGLCGRKYSWNDAEEDGENKDSFHPSGRPPYNVLKAEYLAAPFVHPVHGSWTHQLVQEPETTQFYPTNDPKSEQYSMLESHRTKEMQENICRPVRRLVLVLVLSVCTWVQSLSQLCRSAGGRSSSIQRLAAQTCRRRRERTSADRADVSLKTRQTDVDIIICRWCKVCSCCSRLLMLS